MSKVLDTIGINGSIGQANVILINNCQQFCWALLGANLVDRIGRRPLLLFSNAGCCVVWLAMTVSAAMYQKSIPAATEGVPKVWPISSIFLCLGGGIEWLFEILSAAPDQQNPVRFLAILLPQC